MILVKLAPIEVGEGVPLFTFSFAFAITCFHFFDLWKSKEKAKVNM